VTRFIRVEGKDLTPDGYRDYLLWEGKSWWQAFRAVRAGLKESQTVTVTIYA
jgi:hypothetical protein